MNTHRLVKLVIGQKLILHFANVKVCFLWVRLITSACALNQGPIQKPKRPDEVIKLCFPYRTILMTPDLNTYPVSTPSSFQARTAIPSTSASSVTTEGCWIFYPCHPTPWKRRRMGRTRFTCLTRWPWTLLSCVKASATWRKRIQPQTRASTSWQRFLAPDVS